MRSPLLDFFFCGIKKVDRARKIFLTQYLFQFNAHSKCKRAELNEMIVGFQLFPVNDLIN